MTQTTILYRPVGQYELWIPATELAEFNQHLAGLIEVIAEFRGLAASLNAAAT